jgi:hypothetical protein
MTADELALARMDDDGYGCAITTTPAAGWDTAVFGPEWTVRSAAGLKAGDRFKSHGTVVTVLVSAEAGTETVGPIGGRPCVRIYGRREDTGRQGTMTFGPSAGVQVLVDAEAPAAPETFAVRVRREVEQAALKHRAAAKPAWRPASNGAHKHHWFLIRGLGAESDRVPLRERYHVNSRGDLIWYKNYQTALAAAGRLNAQEATP